MIEIPSASLPRTVWASIREAMSRQRFPHGAHLGKNLAVKPSRLPG